MTDQRDQRYRVIDTREGSNFQKTRLSMSLADGHKSEVEVYTTNVIIRHEGRFIRILLIALPYAKGN
ncbi:hypothetical protein NPIL_60781 [Nephila pilipes]|uniref:Uncharacterized protein n=1 Tax=Nephila pilipes TaxID=299642 RepID=A0A8X6PR47_NEPPI|nr:hypothetical protein NPIL_60781 [Nephila pilipes]